MEKIFVDISDENEWIRDEMGKNLISIDELLNKLEELITDKINLKKTIDKLERGEDE